MDAVKEKSFVEIDPSWRQMFGLPFDVDLPDSGVYLFKIGIFETARRILQWIPNLGPLTSIPALAFRAVVIVSQGGFRTGDALGLARDFLALCNFSLILAVLDIFFSVIGPFVRPIQQT